MNDTNISLQISLEKFNWAQVVNLGCKYLQKYTHTNIIHLCRCIWRFYSLRPQVFSICSSPLSDNHLIVCKRLIRIIVPHLLKFPPHFKSLSLLPEHPPLFSVCRELSLVNMLTNGPLKALIQMTFIRQQSSHLSGLPGLALHPL